MRTRTFMAGLLMLGAGMAWVISLPTKSDAG
ncbi:hypothetical protein BH11PLA2_BH11PLA2_44850 [soil metagenome]